MLTSRCSLQILQSQIVWGRLLVVCTPHLVQTFCRESKAPGGSGDTVATRRSRRTSITPRQCEVSGSRLTRALGAQTSVMSPCATQGGMLDNQNRPRCPPPGEGWGGAG